MIYARNKHTGEHRLDDGMKTDDEEWVIADEDGWITWEGRECPLPGDVECDAETEMMRYQGVLAKTLQWAKVKRYRPILDADIKKEAPEWDGEGLPPVGCECEMNTRDDWVRATIVFSDGDIAIGRIHDGQNTPSKCDWSRKGFRPIRSEEDRLVEQALKDISAEPDEYGADSVVYRMIKAGYRKAGGDT